MNLREATYNELSFMAFGEAQAVRAELDLLFEELDRLEHENKVFRNSAGELDPRPPA